jgi:hypothetical protein
MLIRRGIVQVAAAFVLPRSALLDVAGNVHYPANSR